MSKSKESLISFAILLFVLGGGAYYLARRTVCLPFVEQCMFITEGENLFNAKGMQMNSGLATVIQSSPPIFLGLGGILLLAGLIKSNKED
jgi:hypothetical protein